MRRPLPREVECPRCGAKVGHGCTTVSRTGLWRAKTHIKRWKAIGIDKPDMDDLHRNYCDGQDRDFEINQRAYEALRK